MPEAKATRASAVVVLRDIEVTHSTTKIATLILPNGNPIAYESAAGKDLDVIKRVTHAAATKNLRNVLQQHEKDIIATTKHHLRLGPLDSCQVQPEWITSGFNVCIPIQVAGSFNGRLLLRYPLPYMQAEPYYPGTVDENMRGEIGAKTALTSASLAYTDLFTYESRVAIYIRLWRRIRRALHRILRYPTLAHFVPNPLRHGLPTAYMIMEFVGSDIWQKLSDTWE
ncbi:hypothetical protein TOPH_08309 [Tolypocladium ophioglossoides CBS 100239]|uniref:Uncharacterized protein n=1 Tax=Tolypocladium ophioglossoides (strain CBS 100239) TaxID=1163406 RepID=A0A0L0MYT7_TOLOC|nr:hypothetical protein TOPH_08309 [Tolypocladium ophioglossoides CBS 100239]